MSDLSEFLLARIAEDEAVAKAAMARNGGTWKTEGLHHAGARIIGSTELGNPHAYNGDTELWSDEDSLGMYAETAAHVARHDPARVLAECDAKRQVVAYCTPDDDAGHVLLEALADPSVDQAALAQAEPLVRMFGAQLDQSLGRVLKMLALPYADHPDYREQWRP